MWHLNGNINNKKLIIIKKDIYENDIFIAAKNIDVTILLAANPDISKAVSEPDIDFHQGTALTQIVLEAVRLGGCRRLLYASGSGVYGDTGINYIDENFSPMLPISTYGASKLGCEALISSYCHMFDIRASAFRFGNVVGGRQTHGVAYDFIKRLRSNPSELRILGNGMQTKPYIHIFDVIQAMEIALMKQSEIYSVYNVAPQDHTSVNEIAELVLNALHINLESCIFNYSGGDRGWKGDIPIVRLDCTKIRKLGWSNKFNSTNALIKSINEMILNSELIYDKN
jgi:UDP-glucose 4-epimerase